MREYGALDEYMSNFDIIMNYLGSRSRETEVEIL